ncbi:MAG TPA: ATP-binding protein, partial [Solirubrobacteraceae bacterium]|nr:ATP-binding protein [Solirubrobacteraceae bacterium]
MEREAGRRRVWGADRRDLEAGSLANWSRALDDQRRELLAGVGHELKTPLSIVLGLCGRLLAADELEAEQTQDVRRIRANAYVLLKRVDELLQVSRLDAGHLAIDPRDVDVAGLIRSSCEGFASVAEMRGQRLVLEAPGQLRAWIDEEKVLSVVSNLVANALKHAPDGGLVRCSVAAVDCRLHIEVADDGPGVAVGQRREIFERYRQASGSASRPSGSGLGLAIVRDLVTLHNGRVTLSDAPEGGALFVVDLPLAPVPGGVEAKGEPAPPTIDVAERQRATVERLRADLEADGRRDAASAGMADADRANVLVVSGDAELGAFVQELLGDAYGVRHAADPLLAARLIADRRPDAVVLDAAAGDSAIAALGRRLGRTPLLTLAASQEDVPALIRAGAHDCVVKPFDSDELRARLDALVERGRAAERSASEFAGLDRAFHGAPVPMALISTEGRIVRVN